MTERKIRIEGVDALTLLGLNDANLHIVEKRFDSTVVVRGDTITLRGTAPEVEQIERIFKELMFLLTRNGNLTTNDVDTVIDLVTANGEPALPKPMASSLSRDELDTLILFTKNQMIRAKTSGQRAYIHEVRKNDIVFAIGPPALCSYCSITRPVAASSGQSPEWDYSHRNLTSMAARANLLPHQRRAVAPAARAMSE